MSRTGYIWVFVVASIVIASAIGGVAVWTDVARGAPPNAPLGFTLGPVPVALSFQGELADTAGKPLSGKYNMRFAIFEVSSGGTPIWPSGSPAYEQHPEIDVDGGLFNTLLGGNGVPISNTVFSSRKGGFLQIWVCKTAGATCNNYDALFPRQVITSVPYAMMAGESAAAQSLVGAQTLLTSATIGFDVATDKASDLSMAIRGKASASSGATVGVKGVSESESDGAIGVWGQAGKANGAGIGVLGQAFSKNIHSVGVKGTATGDGSAIKGSAAAGRGLWGNADSGIAVMGEANTGEGGYFHSNSSDGVLGTSFSSKTGVAAVVGRMEKSLVVEGSEGDTFGVWGDVTLRSHAGSIGVKGTASAGIGVRGESNSNIGVRGQSTSNFGGFFETDSNSQFISGVMGKGKFGGSKGVTGQTSGTNAAAAGVYGQAVGTSGATAGVLGENGSLSDGATGVSGLTTSSTGKTYGVMGETNSGTTDAVGVYGKATKGSTMGVYGENTSGANLAGGVVGVSNTETSNLTIGVWGRTNNPNGFGIYSTGNALVNGELTTNSLKSDDGTLEVGGNVHVGGKLTFGAKKGYLAVPHIAFVPEKHNQEYTNNEVGLRNIGLGSLARKYFNAPVHLPQGAKITRVSFGYYGSGALEGEPATCAGGSEYGDGVCSDGRFWLYRGDILGGSSDVQIAHLRNRTTTVSEVNTTLSASAAISGTAANVDNSKFGYFIQVGLVADNIRFKGAIIEYEYTEP